MESREKTRYRGRLRIWADVLHVVKAEGAAKPTRILYGANLSHERLTKYLDELEAKGLLRHVDEGERSTYSLTPEGEAFLGEYARLKRFTDAFGLEL